MHLTRIEIDPGRRASGRVLASPHRMHGAVATCFSPSVDPGRVLWRVDELERGTFLYLLSRTVPEPAGFVKEHGPLDAAAWESRDYGAVLDAVVDGRSFRFRLRANPVRNVRADPSDGGPRERGKRLAHVTADQQRNWLTDRAPDWGFEIGSGEDPWFDVRERKVWTFERQRRKVTVSTAVFEGRLVVADADRFRRHLVAGLGPAKAYGCGLLTLAPDQPS